MNELQTDVKNQVIIFKDRAEVRVTTQQVENIMRLSCTNKKKFQILNVGIFDFNDIAKMIPIEEYYKLYPDKRPPVYEEKKEIPKVSKAVYSSKRVLELCLNIWKKKINSKYYVATNGGLGNLIRLGEQRLVLLKSGKLKKVEDKFKNRELEKVSALMGKTPEKESLDSLSF